MPQIERTATTEELAAEREKIDRAARQYARPHGRQPSYDPAKVVEQVQDYLQGWFGTLKITRPDDAYMAAAGLLKTMGVTPEPGPDDHTPGAEQVRDWLLESRIPATTRSRRAR